MKQYRYTSENFVLKGESGDADAVMDSNDLRDLKRLAGLTESDPGVWAGPVIPGEADAGIASPLGSNISQTATTRNELEKEYHAQPGTDLWFIINFSKPLLNGSVRDKVEEYLKQHPEYRPRSFPNND